jgi:hypothetical protein
MKKIVIKKVPKDKIRNRGIGDYLKKGGGIEIRVADLNNENDELGVAIHELVESTLVNKRGIKFRDIDKFDKKHEDEDREPGEMKDSPYRKEHLFANAVESAFIKELRKKIKKFNK